MFVTKVEKEIINFERETKKNVKNRNNVYFCKETLFHKYHCFIQKLANMAKYTHNKMECQKDGSSLDNTIYFIF